MRTYVDQNQNTPFCECVRNKLIRLDLGHCEPCAAVGYYRALRVKDGSDSWLGPGSNERISCSTSEPTDEGDRVASPITVSHLPFFRNFTEIV